MPTEKVYKKVNKLDNKPKEAQKKETSEGKKLSDFVFGRIDAMKAFKRTAANGKDIEEIWKSADNDYEPRELSKFGKGKRFESDPETGLRSRPVPIGKDLQSWRNDNSEPTLLVKIQTALSIIIDKDPEAFLTAMRKKYEATTNLARSLYETSWHIDKSKQQLKLFAFNLAKYGWAAGRTYPRIIKRNKKILVTIDTENPENNVYEDKIITDFNGLHRESLSVYRTWIDEMARPNDRFSLNDWYFEKDYSYDSAELEFGDLPGFEFVSKQARSKIDGDKKQDNRDDVITVGFYENKNKDLFAIVIPSQKLVVFSSPLPNDEGKLSIWQTYWSLRSDDSPYGIGVYEIIRQKKSLYDKFMNMTMDQLVLSIYKMFFYSGTNPLIGDGELKIEPGKGVQNLGGSVDFLEIPGPGQDAFKGIQILKSGIDDDSGITPTLEGELTGKTLGEILHAKEAALKRMNIPLDNIGEALEEDAYLTLSWMNQILSTPEVKSFTDEAELRKYEEENELEGFETIETENGILASFYPEVRLGLDFDSNQRLIESKEERFFKIGKDIPISSLKWEGIVRVDTKSILTPSIELEKQRKLELFNILIPILPGDPSLFAKPVKQILSINDEDLEDWLPDTWVQFLESGNNPVAEPLFVDVNMAPDASMKTDSGMGEQKAPTVVPKDELSGISQSSATGQLGQTFRSQ